MATFKGLENGTSIEVLLTTQARIDAEVIKTSSIGIDVYFAEEWAEDSEPWHSDHSRPHKFIPWSAISRVNINREGE